jgi:hypothetical protein
MIIAESTILEDLDTGKVEKHCCYFIAKALEVHRTRRTEDTFNNATNDEQIIVFTDKSTSCVNIVDYVEIHMTKKSNEQTTKET